MPSIRSPFQSPATGTTAGQLAAGPKWNVDVAPDPVMRVCQTPVWKTARSSVPSLFQSPTTGNPRALPKVMLTTGEPSRFELRSLNTPASKVPAVLVPFPSQSPMMGTSGLVPYVNVLVGGPEVRES